ncbi:RDD family protein [Gulosibacter bifidus]|uniref:RDD family protein n=1 Tax=Gulosibacter bifidus TaxID=272239 RepID=A0ABW5RJU1_9MICO|nr:RDD family protein [Gulosibacter bifidus]
MPSSTRSGGPSYLDDDIVIGEGVALAVPAASLMARAGSAVIDAICYVGGLLGSMMLLGWAIANFAAKANVQIEDAWFPVLLISWVMLWLVLLPIAVELLTQGRSLGKLIFGLRVVRNDGGAVGLRHVAIRQLVGLGEIYLTSGAIAACVGIFNGKARRVGDLLAGTYAQVERVPQPVPLHLPLPPQLQAWAQIADVARIPDVTARRVHEYFMQAHQLTPQARVAVAGDLARQCRPFVHPIPDVDAETFLLGVSVVRRDREYASARRRADRITRIAGSAPMPHGLPNRG